MDYNKINFEQDAFTMSGQSGEGICGYRTGVRTRGQVRHPDAKCGLGDRGEGRMALKGGGRQHQGLGGMEDKT